MGKDTLFPPTPHHERGCPFLAFPGMAKRQAATRLRQPITLPIRNLVLEADHARNLGLTGDRQASGHPLTLRESDRNPGATETDRRLPLDRLDRTIRELTTDLEIDGALVAGRLNENGGTHFLLFFLLKGRGVCPILDFM